MLFKQRHQGCFKRVSSALAFSCPLNIINQLPFLCPRYFNASPRIFIRYVCMAWTCTNIRCFILTSLPTYHDQLARSTSVIAVIELYEALMLTAPSPRPWIRRRPNWSLSSLPLHVVYTLQIYSTNRYIPKKKSICTIQLISNQTVPRCLFSLTTAG